MHLLIPFAALLPEAQRAANEPPALPRLQSLLGQLAEAARDEGEESDFSPPHERALARALGLRGGPGRLPFAALAATADGIATGDLAWGLITPAHWQLGTHQVSLLDPAELQLDEAASRAFFEVLHELFAGDGFALHYGAPLRWYAAHPSLAGLATASLDRVIGRHIDAWLATDPAARRIRRLQSEAQMLLYSHPLNAEREAAGRLPLNSFWLSQCGVGQSAHGKAPMIDERLRQPALAGDRSAWLRAWEALDAGPLAEMQAAVAGGQRVALTLCGERSWVRLEATDEGWLRRQWRRRSAPTPAALLATL